MSITVSRCKYDFCAIVRDVSSIRHVLRTILVVGAYVEYESAIIGLVTLIQSSPSNSRLKYIIWHGTGPSRHMIAMDSRST